MGEACSRCAAACWKGRGARVRAVGLSGLGPCVLPADADGRPLRPAILYGIDSRASDQVERLTAELGADAILARCGSRLSSQSVGPKLRWLAEEEPQVWSATRRVFGASSYIVACLTGEYVLDHHSASHWAPLYDVHENAWIDEWVRTVAPGWRCHGWSGRRRCAGRVSPEAAAATGIAEGIPVAGGWIDSWARWWRRGCAAPGRDCSSTGPACSSSRWTARRTPDARLWSTVGFAPGSLNIAAGVASGGALTAWLRGPDRRGAYDELYEEAAASGPGPAASLRCPTSPASARRCSTPTCAAWSSG